MAFVGAEDENGDGAILRTSSAVELDGWMGVLYPGHPGLVWAPEVCWAVGYYLGR